MRQSCPGALKDTSGSSFTLKVPRSEPQQSAVYGQESDANIRALAGGGGRIIEGMQVRTSGGTVGRRRPLPHLSRWILPANDSKGRHEKADHRRRGALFRLTLFMYMSDRLSASEANGPPGGMSRAWTAEITMCVLFKERFYKKIKK